MDYKKIPMTNVQDLGNGIGLGLFKFPVGQSFDLSKSYIEFPVDTRIYSASVTLTKESTPMPVDEQKKIVNILEKEKESKYLSLLSLRLSPNDNLKQIKSKLQLELISAEKIKNKNKKFHVCSSIRTAIDNLPSQMPLNGYVIYTGNNLIYAFEPFYCVTSGYDLLDIFDVDPIKIN